LVGAEQLLALELAVGSQRPRPVSPALRSRAASPDLQQAGVVVLEGLHRAAVTREP